MFATVANVYCAGACPRTPVGAAANTSASDAIKAALVHCEAFIRFPSINAPITLRAASEFARAFADALESSAHAARSECGIHLDAGRWDAHRLGRPNRHGRWR